MAPTPPEERVLAPAPQQAGVTGPAAGQGPPTPGETDDNASGTDGVDDEATRAGTDADAAEAEPARPHLAAVKEPRRIPLFGLRQVATVVKAVYAALADPVTADDERTREIRAARLRRAGIIVGSTVLAVLLVYSIFPVREFLDHRAVHSRQTERRDVLVEANERQEERREWLESDEGIESLAREHGFIYPDEEPVNVLPAPEDDSEGDRD